MLRKPVTKSLPTQPPRISEPPSELRKPVAVQPGMTLSETFAKEDAEKTVDAEAKPKRTYHRRDITAES